MLSNKMKKEGNIGIALIANVFSIAVTAFISFFLTKYLIEEIGRVAYSYYPIANNFVNYFSVMFLVINSMSARFVTVSLNEQGEEESKAYFSSIFFANVIISLLILLIAVVYVFNINSFLEIPSELLNSVKILFATTFLTVIINALANVYSVGPYVKRRMDINAGVEIVTTMFKCIILIALIYVNKLDLVTFGYSLLLVAIVSLLIKIFVTRRLLPTYKIKFGYFDYHKLVKVLKSGAWSIINNIGLLLITNSQLIIVNNISIIEGSELAVAQTLYSLALTFCSNFSAMYTPYVLNILTSNTEDKGKKIDRMQSVSLITLLLPCCLLMALSKDFYKLWLPNENANILFVYSFLLILQLIFRYVSSIGFSIQVTFNDVKIPAIAQLITGLGYYIVASVGASVFKLGTIFVLVMAVVAFIIYGYIFMQININKLLFEKGLNVRVNYTKDVILITVLIISNTFIANRFINIDSWICLFVVGILFLLADFIIILLIKKEKPVNLFKFVFHDNN